MTDTLKIADFKLTATLNGVEVKVEPSPDFKVIVSGTVDVKLPIKTEE